VLLANHHLVASLLGKTLSQFCITKGVDVFSVANGLQIDPSRFQDPEAYISQAKFSRLLETLSFLTSDKFFAHNYASDFNLSHLGIFGLGYFNAPTLYHALKFHERYASLLSDHTKFCVTASDGKVRMKWQYSPFLTLHHQLVDFEMTIAVRLIRYFAGNDWLPNMAFLNHEKSIQLRGCPWPLAHRVIHNTDITAICFSQEFLAVKNNHADAKIFSLLERHCEHELKTKLQSTPLALRVRHELLYRLPLGGFTLQEFAKTFGMSERNFQRKLVSENVTFELLLEETRKEFSDHLLKDLRLTLSEIAHKLGYSSPNSYSRAARQWYHKPPSKMREPHPEVDPYCQFTTTAFSHDVQKAS
jgi:AraC-like DNA-binding protein